MGIKRQGVLLESTQSETSTSRKKDQHSVHNIVIPSLTAVSATKIRNSTDMNFLRENLHPDVLLYIQREKLYSFNHEQTKENKNEIKIKHITKEIRKKECVQSDAEKISNKR